MPSTLPAPIDKLAIVVVTYKRQELLANLFDSMTELTATPWRIVIVDNENSRETEAMTVELIRSLGGGVSYMIVNEAGAKLEGIGIAVEKGFQGGGDKLRAAGVNLHSLAIIESAEPGNIVFREEA